MLASQNGAIRQNQLLKQLEVVAPDRITYINRSARNGTRSGMEFGARMIRLEHIPIRVDKVSHPQAVVGAVHHVTPLQPIRAVWISGRVSAPKIIPCMNEWINL